MYGAGVMAEELHDIDLPIPWWLIIAAITEQPECRPDSSTLGELYPRLEVTIRLAELLIRGQSSRSVATRAIPTGKTRAVAPQRADDQVTRTV
jgi:hypothetical protein